MIILFLSRVIQRARDQNTGAVADRPMTQDAGDHCKTSLMKCTRRITRRAGRSERPSPEGSRVCETCCICLDDEATAHPFPCCGRETSTQRCCAACLERVCHQIGQCPSCRAALHWDERRSVAVLGHAEPPPRRSRDLLWTLTLFMMQPFGFAALKLLEGTARLLFGDQQPFGLAFSFYRVIPRGGPFH